jgi:hypothetical protein
MPDIISTAQQKNEWKLANALKEYLPASLVWKSIGGYPILYRTGFLGSARGVAFFTGDKQQITIERRRWKDAILETLKKYKDTTGISIEVKYTFDIPKKFKKGDRYAN